MESTQSKPRTAEDKVEVTPAERLSPLRPAAVGITRFKFDRVEELARTANKIVSEVVEKYAKPLDELVADVEETLRRLKENRTQIAPGDLQRLVMRIPVELYRIIDMVDMAGITSDVAQMAHKLVQADYYAKEAKGTIPERTRLADLKAGDEATIVDLAKHAHNRLRRRMEVASLLFDAVRKVISTQDVERKVFGGES